MGKYKWTYNRRGEWILKNGKYKPLNSHEPLKEEKPKKPKKKKKEE